MKIYTTYFSATNTTKTIVNKIANEMGDVVQNYNITCHPLATDILIPSNDLLIVGMPVYGGRIPSIAVDSLKHFKGEHTPVILISVYGNRAFEDSFVELQDICESNGFVVQAAAAFVAQHSIFPQTAHNRPDESDEKKMNEFAEKCKLLLMSENINERRSIIVPGNRPYKTPGNIPLKIKTNTHCTECGTCAKLCPVQAIPLQNPRLTAYDKCIHCGRCIYVCPTQARIYNGFLYHFVKIIFSYKNRKRKEPEFFF